MFFISSIIITCASLFGGSRLFNMCYEPINNNNDEDDDSIENEFNEIILSDSFPVYDIIEDENNSPDYEKKQCHTLEYTNFLNDRIILKI